MVPGLTVQARAPLVISAPNQISARAPHSAADLVIHSAVALATRSAAVASATSSAVAQQGLLQMVGRHVHRLARQQHRRNGAVAAVANHQTGLGGDLIHGHRLAQNLKSLGFHFHNLRLV